MNKTKLSNPVRLIAFFLTAVILICTFGFTVDGWQNNDADDTPSKEDKNNEDEGEGTEDLPTDTDPEPEEPKEPVIYIPEFVNRLTGVETTEEISKTTPLAFIMNGEESCYGISRSDLLIEIPTENGGSRLVSFVTDRSELWKIGSLASARGYITNLAKFFGAIAVYNGLDDNISYESCDVTFTSFDVNENKGYHYTEYSDKCYTNCELIDAGLSSAGIKNVKTEDPSLPFEFTKFGENNVIYEVLANKAEIIGDDGERLELIYNSENAKYTYLKNNNTLTDALNGKALEFTNCLVLFADSIVYDNSNCNQMVMDTIGSGRGYCLTGGSVTEIRWTSTAGGIFTFYTTEGEKLTVNRGNTYISFLKSSRFEYVTFL